MKFTKLLLAAALTCTTPAFAAVQTTTLSFTASDFILGMTGAALPDEPAISGSFTFSYDDALPDSGADLAVDAVSLVIAGHAYRTAEIRFRTIADAGVRGFFVGGIANGGLEGLGEQTDDFALTFAPGAASMFVFTRPGMEDLAYASADISLQTLSPAVPEPASWALMIGGFGLVGGLARRRGRSVIARA